MRVFAETDGLFLRNAGRRIKDRMLVFINPDVASLPQHDHLFGGDGCIFGAHHPLVGMIICFVY